jgi:tRNA dimethylallyltransferase
MSGPLLALVGPTASGKTDAAVDVAEAIGAEVVCVDSMLVYRGMDVGTAKPSPEHRRRVRHHLLDLADPAERFSVERYQGLARRAIASIRERGSIPLLVGSGGLYFRAVVDALEFPTTEPRVRDLLEAEARVVGPAAMHRRLIETDPDAASRIDPANVRRSVRALEVMAVTGRPFSSFSTRWRVYPPAVVRVAGIDVPRPLLHRRIEARVESMMPGILEEAADLRARGFGRFLTASQAIGYAEAVALLEGRVGLDEATARTVRRTKALARRQLAWLRRDPRIEWFGAGADGAVGRVQDLVAFLAQTPEPAAVADRR